MSHTKAVKRLLHDVRCKLDDDNKKMVEPYLRQILDISKPVVRESNHDQQLRARNEAQKAETQRMREDLQKARVEIERLKGRVSKAESELAQVDAETLPDAIRRTMLSTDYSYCFAMGIALVAGTLLDACVGSSPAPESKLPLAEYVADRIERLIWQDREIHSVLKAGGADVAQLQKQLLC
ncbi:MAG TPA: hypothetical protein VHC22_32390 [Pirellulales bacterium]|nr:hypothetical protein [Pirellulales bacterium]